MEPQPLVSILINNYNYGRFLGDAIDSALNQTYPHIEVIVVDDGSTDDSREVIASYGDRIIPILKENGGQASAFNAGFEASKGDIICFLDADDLFLPQKASRVVRALQSHPGAGWCFHPLTWLDMKDGSRRRDETERVLTSAHESGGVELDFRKSMRRGNLPFMAPATSGLCFRRVVLAQILPMPEASGVSLSDHFLKFGACSISKGVLLDETLAEQRIHGGNAFTQKQDRWRSRGIIFTTTAYWLRRRFPPVAPFANNIFAIGLASFWHGENCEESYQQLVRQYLSEISIHEKFSIYVRAYYHRWSGRLP